MDKAKCPRCRKPSTTPCRGKDRFYCHHCRMEFEGEDDGTVTYGDPSRIAELRELRQLHGGRRR